MPARDSIPLRFTLDAGAGVFEVDTTRRASSAAVAAKRERSDSRKALNASFPVWFVGTEAARMTRANASCWLEGNPPKGHDPKNDRAWGAYLDRHVRGGRLKSTGEGYVLA